MHKVDSRNDIAAQFVWSFCTPLASAACCTYSTVFTATFLRLVLAAMFLQVGQSDNTWAPEIGSMPSRAVARWLGGYVPPTGLYLWH